jgi:hypothetical protein
MPLKRQTPRWPPRRRWFDEEHELALIESQQGRLTAAEKEWEKVERKLDEMLFRELGLKVR